MKPGLDSAMKEARLQFYLRYRHWTLEDWKNVIWSDETSVVLGSRRGRRLQWRTSKEKYTQTCIRRRWKGCSEFMFWSCYSYEKKGPFHVWKPETASEKRAAQTEIDKINKTLEPLAKESWELVSGSRLEDEDPHLERRLDPNNATSELYGKDFLRSRTSDIFSSCR